MSRWQFTDQERAAIAAGADMLLSVWTFGHSLQPLYAEVAEVDRSLPAIVDWLRIHGAVKKP